MSRALSNAARRATLASESDEVWVWLLTLEADGLASPIRVNNGRASITYATHEYVAFPFALDIVDDSPESIPQVELRISNVDRRVVAAVRSVFEVRATFGLMLASQIGTWEAGPMTMLMRNVSYNVQFVVGELLFSTFHGRAYPSHTFSPVTHPGLF